MALDKVTAAVLDVNFLTASETAPSSPGLGQRWFKASSGVTYQYTTDGSTNFWLDISSGGIGKYVGRGVDYVGDADPTASHNGGSATLTVGQIYLNRVTNRSFKCTTATSGSNVWVGIYDYSGITGGTITTYGSYRVHTFTSNGTFQIDSAKSVDYLVVAGGAAGGDSNTNSGGGGGAGGFRTAAGFSVTAQAYTITVGGGGTAGTNVRGASGDNSSIVPVSGTSIISVGGGGGGAQTVNAAGVAGGSGGGGSYATGAGGAGTSGQGNAGGNVNADGSANAAGGGGGGAGGVGEVGSQANDAAAQAGNGGVGEDQVMGLNATDSFTLLTNASAGHLDNGARYFAGGGAGEAYSLGVADGGLGGGGASAVAGTANTGGGGGGGSNGGTNRTAGSGGSGIVIIRYAI
jgi:hypothetical protein